MERAGEILKRIMSLPCISTTDDYVFVTFHARFVYSKKLFENNPIFFMNDATNRLETKCENAIEEKRRVLAEIEGGTNRFSVVPGGFENVGK